MRWDDPIFSGTHSNWHWAVSRREVLGLDALVAEHFAGQYLCITAFDGGSYRPVPKKLATGWSLADQGKVSPPLARGLEIPNGGHDEWYVLNRRPKSLPLVDRFLQYRGFNLADPREVAVTFDPTWERSGLDWLYPIQELFWYQMDVLDATAYVASGNNSVVASTNLTFVARFLELAQGTIT